MKPTKIIELLIDEKDEQTGIHAVSVVHSPAIEENFIALSKLEVELKEVDVEKKILMGAALIPNKQIIRANKDGEPYYIYFSDDTVRKASELFLMRSNQNNATIEHAQKLSGMSVVESWLIEDEVHDKSVKYGFSLPKGTWMISMKCNNEEVWQDVKAGKVKGFSIEGYFADKLEMSKKDEQKDEIIEMLKDILNVKAASYTDYPDVVKRNAQRGIMLNEKNGNKCATQVGKIRAQQLANGEPVTEETIKRMFSYLSRAEVYYDKGESEDCGYISYLLWGGKAAKDWAESKLNEIEKQKQK